MRDLHVIVLASVSPRRHELLTSLGFRVRVVPSLVHEGERPGLTPLELAVAHASAKATAVAAREPQATVLGADTVVDLDGIALGKPHDEAAAHAMLHALSGRDHVVHTAFCLIDGPSGRRHAASNSTRVRFETLSARDIAEYVATGDPFDKAGAYGIQGRGATLVERIDGDFYTVMGLPLGGVVKTLRALGYRLPAAIAPGALAEAAR